jgi:hypothetical protein
MAAAIMRETDCRTHCLGVCSTVPDHHNTVHAQQQRATVGIPGHPSLESTKRRSRNPGSQPRSPRALEFGSQDVTHHGNSAFGRLEDRIARVPIAHEYVTSSR